MSARDRWSSWWTGRFDPALADARDEAVEIANQLAAARRRIDHLAFYVAVADDANRRLLAERNQAVKDRDDLLELRAVNDVLGLFERKPE